MKIEGPNSSKPTSSTRKAGGAANPSDAAEFRGMMSGGAEETSATHTTNQIAKLDLLLAVQGADDPAQRAARKRMTARAGDLLKGLETIRNGLLLGSLTVGHMVDIADVIASHREKIHDPELTGLMDEIDLRAQVEIAKMRRALDVAASATAQ
jgi:hypothetical protein